MRVLFVTYGGGHVHMVTAVAAALRRQAPEMQLTALGLPAAHDRLVAAGLEVIGFEDVLDPVRDADALNWGADLAQIHHAPHTGIPLARSVAYLGLSFKDLVVREGLSEAEARVSAAGRNAFYQMTILERVLDRVRPDLVVATNSPRAEAAAIATARARGLSTIVMIDLFSGMRNYRIEAEDIVFLNETARDSCQAQEILPPVADYTPHFLGNPAFDSLITLRAKPDPEWLEQTFPGSRGRPVVLFADMPAWEESATGQPYRKTVEETRRELDLVAAAAQFAGAVLAVRPHPSQSREVFETFVAETPNTHLAVAQDLRDLLLKVDLVVARSTTVALEACFLRQKVLQLEPSRHTDLPLVRMGIAEGADDLTALGAVMERCLSDGAAQAQRAARADLCLPNKPAAPRIAQLIVTKLDCNRRTL